MEAEIEQGTHVSALFPAAMEKLASKIESRLRQGQYTVVLWDDIKVNPPKQLKVSPIVMIPQKSCLLRTIFDLSFGIRLANGN